MRKSEDRLSVGPTSNALGLLSTKPSGRLPLRFSSRTISYGCIKLSGTMYERLDRLDLGIVINLGIAGLFISGSSNTDSIYYRILCNVKTGHEKEG